MSTINVHSLMHKSKPELDVMAKSVGLRSIQNKKKEEIATLILKQSVPVVAPVVAPEPAPVVAPVVVPEPAPVVPRYVPPQSRISPVVTASVSGSSVASSRDSVPKKAFVADRSVSFDAQKLTFVFTFLRPSYYTSEYSLLQTIWDAHPESVALNAGHVNPNGDKTPHYTVTFARTLESGFRSVIHYHLRYEFTPSGKEVFTELTNRQREVIADFRRRSG
jgi:hypothetical protein